MKLNEAVNLINKAVRTYAQASAAEVLARKGLEEIFPGKDLGDLWGWIGDLAMENPCPACAVMEDCNAIDAGHLQDWIGDRPNCGGAR